MNELQGMKELYDVVVKATYPIEMGDRKIEEGEILLSFDKVQMGGLQEAKMRHEARGGFDNRPWVFWEATRELPLSFTQGIFSVEHLALISNSRMVEINDVNSVIVLTRRESKESSEHGIIELEKAPVGKPFVYEMETGQKLDYVLSGKQIVIEKPFCDVQVHYEWEYQNGGKNIQVGRRLLNGYLKLEAKTRLKEDINGRTTTGIIYIPKLKLMSDLSIMLGRNAEPMTVNFNAVGVPVGGRGTSYVCNFIALNDDID